MPLLGIAAAIVMFYIEGKIFDMLLAALGEIVAPLLAVVGLLLVAVGLYGAYDTYESRHHWYS